MPIHTKPKPTRPRRRLIGKYVGYLVALVGGTLLAGGLVEIYYSLQENEAALIGLQQEKAKGRRRASSSSSRHRRRGRPRLVAAARYRARRPQAPASRLPTAAAQGPCDHRHRPPRRIGNRAAHGIAARDGRDRRGSGSLRRTRLQGGQGQQCLARPGLLPQGDRALHDGGDGAARRSSPVTMAEVNLKFIWDVVSDIKVGGEGYAFAVDVEGNLIATPTSAGSSSAPICRIGRRWQRRSSRWGAMGATW